MSEIQSTTQVEYRLIPGYPGHRVGTDGTVWSRLVRGARPPRFGEWRKRKPVPNQHGRLSVAITSRYRTQIHRLVLEVFVGPCPEGMECCHGDGNNQNNALSNLRWDTSKSNKADQVIHGTAQLGSNHSGAKLTDIDVINIRSDYANGVTYKELIVKYNISYQHVWTIIRRKRWRHI